MYNDVIHKICIHYYQYVTIQCSLCMHACVCSCTQKSGTVGILSLRYSSKLDVPLVSIARRGLRNEFPPNSKCLKTSVVLINTKSDLLTTIDYIVHGQKGKIGHF